MAFRYRSRRPVLAYARTEHNADTDLNLLFCLAMFYLTEPTGKGRFLESDQINYSKSINSEQGGEPLFLESDLAIIVRFYSMAFRLRSRHPVRPKGRTAYNDKILQLNSFLH